MKTLKIVLLTTLISFFIFVLSVFIVFKFFITPERINKYLETAIEKNIKSSLAKSEANMLDELYTPSKSASYKYYGNELDDLKTLERLTNITNLKDMKIFDNLNDVSYLSSQLFNNINMKMELLKYRINEYISNKNTKEE